MTSLSCHSSQGCGVRVGPCHVLLPILHASSHHILQTETYMETDGVSWALAVPGVVSMPFCAELEPDQSHELRRYSPHFANEGRRNGTLVW